MFIHLHRPGPPLGRFVELVTYYEGYESDHTKEKLLPDGAVELIVDLANGFTEADLKRGSPAVIFGVSFVFCLVMAANLAAFLAGPDTTLAWAVTASVLAGLGWATLGLGVIALFERRPWSYMLVNGGYLTISFAAMGVVLGIWRWGP